MSRLSKKRRIQTIDSLMKKNRIPRKKMESGGSSGTMGLVSSLVGLLEEVGAAGKADYGATNEDGSLKNPTKNTVGGIIGTILDPIGALTDYINGNSWIDAKKRGEKAAKEYRMNQLVSKAKEANKVGEAAQNMLDEKNNIRLKCGGKVKRKRAGTGGVIRKLKHKPQPNKPEAEIIPPGIDDFLRGMQNGGLVTGKEGVDKNKATLEENSFVIPRSALKGKKGKDVKDIIRKVGLDRPLIRKESGGNVPVLLSKGEYVIPPNKINIVTAMLKKKGIPSLDSLAPNAEDKIGKVDGGEVSIDSLRERYTELYNKSKTGKLNPVELDEMQKTLERMNIIWTTEELDKELASHQSKAVAPETVFTPNGNKATIEYAKRQTGKPTQSELETFKSDINIDRKISSAKIPPEKMNYKFGQPRPDDSPKEPPAEETGMSSGTKMQVASGAVQMLGGILGMSTIGESPLNKADEIIKERYNPGITRLALARLEKIASFGIDPASMSEMERTINENYANEEAKAIEGSGSPAETFSRRSAQGLMKMRALAELKSRDAEIKTQKQTALASSMIDADRFFLNVHDSDREFRWRKLMMEQQEWQTEANNWGELISAGMKNMNEAPRMNEFYREMMKYSNPYKV